MPPQTRLRDKDSIMQCEHGIRTPWQCHECDEAAIERLNAAAPDIYAALKNLVSACADDWATEEQLLAAGLSGTYVKAITIARAALAKAV